MSDDPFDPQNIGTIQFIMLARLYDVALAILTEMNPDAASDLLEVHHSGGIAGTSPSMSGVFISDETNQ